MKISLKTLIALALLGPALAMANPKLVGTWKTTGGSERALHGVMELHADGSALLGPEGYSPLVGTWAEKEKGTITLEMPPHGSSNATYKLSRMNLTLTYNTGDTQQFVLQPAPKTNGKKR